MAQGGEQRSFFETDNPYAVGETLRDGRGPAVGLGVGLLGASACYEVLGRRLEIYWSHWTGWESYHLDGRPVSSGWTADLRRRQRILLDAATGDAIEIEASSLPAFRVRIWRQGGLLHEDIAPQKRAFDRVAGALLALAAAFTTAMFLTALCFLGG